mgnify:CR=1 FL=1
MQQKIIFMGTPQFSVPILETLAKSSYQISCVYTQPPKKSNRGLRLNSSPIELSSKNLKLVVRSPINLNTDEELKFFKEINPDIVIVVAYGQLIPKKFLEIPKKGFINVHASLLPKWRGSAPIQRAIMNLDRKTGISIMKIEEKLDYGPVMKKTEIDISPYDTAGSISEKLSKISSKDIVKVLDDIFEEKAKFVVQDHNNSTYAKKIKKNETKINWAEDAEIIVAKINSFNPEPGAWFEYKNTRYKVWKASVFNKVGSAGTILDNNFIIGCNDKSIKIIEIQREGRNKLSLENFLLGTNFKIGEMIG